jgi:hypothetical protein
MESSDSLEDKEIENIKKDEKVQRALSETSISVQKESTVALEEEAPFLGITAIVFLGCGILYFLLGWKRIPISSTYIPLAQKLCLRSC